MARKLSGYDKAAILLMSVGEEAATEIIKTLDPKDLRKISSIITNTADLPADEVDFVIGEFTEQLRSRQGAAKVQGRMFLQRTLTKALGQEKAQLLLDNAGAVEEHGLDNLKWLEPKTIAETIQHEHPQIIALILSNLGPEQSSQVLMHLEEALRSQVLVRLATIEEVPNSLVKEVNDALVAQLSQIPARPSSRRISGAKLAANILNKLDRTAEQTILNNITQRNNDLAETIRQLQFVFDDLVQLDDRTMQEVLKEVNKDQLTVALKAAKEEVRNKFYKNMSERAVQMLKEDMEAKGPIKLSEVEKTQQEILKVVRKMIEEGKITLGGKGGGEGDVLV